MRNISFVWSNVVSFISQVFCQLFPNNECLITGDWETSERVGDCEGHLSEAERWGPGPPGDLWDWKGQLDGWEGKSHQISEAASAQLCSGKFNFVDKNLSIKLWY